MERKLEDRLIQTTRMLKKNYLDNEELLRANPNFNSHTQGYLKNCHRTIGNFSDEVYATIESYQHQPDVEPTVYDRLLKQSVEIKKQIDELISVL